MDGVGSGRWGANRRGLPAHAVRAVFLRRCCFILFVAICMKAWPAVRNCLRLMGAAMQGRHPNEPRCRTASAGVSHNHRLRTTFTRMRITLPHAFASPRNQCGLILSGGPLQSQGSG